MFRRLLYLPAMQRLLMLVGMIWGLVTLLFLIFNLLGDPAGVVAGQRTDLRTLESIRAELGLDRPPWQQYLFWLNDLSPIAVLSAAQQASGNYNYVSLASLAEERSLVIKTPWLRRSFQNNRPVAALYAERLPATALLAGSSLLFAALLGIGMGVVASRKPGGSVDGLLTAVSLVGLSTPSFFAALLVAWLLAIEWHAWTGLNPTGYVVRDSIFHPGQTWIDLRYLILPALTLGVRPLSVIFQLTREQMIDVRGQDFVRTARAKGLSMLRTEWLHALRNALNPVLTSLSAWLGALLGGSFFVEYVFDWPGVGKLTVDALMTNDYPVLMGCCLFTAMIFVFIQFFMDWVYRWLDPRIRK